MVAHLVMTVSKRQIISLLESHGQMLAQKCCFLGVLGEKESVSWCLVED